MSDLKSKNIIITGASGGIRAESKVGLRSASSGSREHGARWRWWPASWPHGGGALQRARRFRLSQVADRRPMRQQGRRPTHFGACNRRRAQRWVAGGRRQGEPSHTRVGCGPEAAGKYLTQESALRPLCSGKQGRL